MATELKLAVLFTGVDRISGVMDTIGRKFDSVAERATNLGERIAGIGERMALQSAIISEGASKLQEWGAAIIEPAAGMEQAMARVGARFDFNAGQLENLRGVADKFAASHPEATPEAFVAAFAPMQAMYHNIGSATDATTRAFELAKVSGADIETTTGILSLAYKVMGVDAGKAGDMVAKTLSLYSVDKPELLMQTLSRVGGVFKATNTSLAEGFSITGLIGETLKGRGAMQFGASLTEFVNKSLAGGSRIDFSQGIMGGLQQMATMIDGLPEIDKLRKLGEIGVSNPGAWLQVIENLGEVSSKTKLITGASGDLHKMYGKSIDNLVDKMAIFKHQAAAMLEEIGGPALPAITSAFRFFGDVLEGVGNFFKKHSTTAKILTLSIAGLGTFLGVANTLLMAGSAGAVLFGNGLKLAGFALDFEGHAIRFLYLKDTIMKVVGAASSLASKAVSLGASLVETLMPALYSAATAIYSFGAALSFVQILSGIGIILVLAAAAYELYENWASVTKLFSGVWSQLERGFSSAFGWVSSLGEVFGSIGATISGGLSAAIDWIGSVGARFYDAGANLMKMLGDGIASAIMWPVHKIEELAGRIGRLIIGHSPPPEGPLSKLGRGPSIVDTFADSMQPAPAMRAIHRMAAVAAIAMPMALSAAPSYAALPARGAPVADSGIYVTVNQTVNIDGEGKSAADLRAELEKHADYLVDIIQRKLARKNRREY
ncbi:MAG: phage tail tape measure protein [Candidatus Binatus sp.]|uniref:phage tail tape measure protein n=1 Tax=Candidatus Binatus sp. TaxID=2811406 RepID=UPI002716826C|nr:phage tail tape measure protein [Candidatus Binatus sp.]MDO8431776.1 phage tail tape measure protein [Candidatus Binatus sp.]